MAHVKTNFPNIARRMTARMNGTGPAQMAAMRRNKAIVLAELEELSGTQHYSTAELRRMGHPYARRDPRPPMPPYVLSRQRGAIAEGWRVDIRQTLTHIVATIKNKARHGRYILAENGTSKMIARPIITEALRRTSPARLTNLLRAKRKAEKIL